MKTIQIPGLHGEYYELGHDDTPRQGDVYWHPSDRYASNSMKYPYVIPEDHDAIVGPMGLGKYFRAAHGSEKAYL